MSNTVANYLAFLFQEMQKDAAVLDTPWVYLTGVPFLLYVVYMAIKWFMLLAPVTIPLTLIFSRPATKFAWFKPGKN